MNSILTLAFGILLSLGSYAQDNNPDRTISLQDSALLREFWSKFTDAIEKKDKDKLGTLCELPFYCRPCIDDTMIKNNDHVTIKVTKKIFQENVYKVFFDKPVSDKAMRYKNFEAGLFYPALDDRNKPDGFMFSYTIVAPSKKWEGLQGFIYLNKKNGRFKITGIDTVP